MPPRPPRHHLKRKRPEETPTHSLGEKHSPALVPPAQSELPPKRRRSDRPHRFRLEDVDLTDALEVSLHPSVIVTQNLNVTNSSRGLQRWVRGLPPEKNLLGPQSRFGDKLIGI